MKTTSIVIEGMSCQHCVKAVEQELSIIEGLTVRDVQIGSASMEYDEAAVTDAEIDKAVERAGYRVIREG